MAIFVDALGDSRRSHIYTYKYKYTYRGLLDGTFEKLAIVIFGCAIESHASAHIRYSAEEGHDSDMV